jgi:HAE1 family hydrophobic/amphiphilic exporter-1
MISRFFIQRPVFASVIAIIIVIAGLVTYRSLPVARHPDISPPTVQVRAFYPGANANVVNDTVAQPLEQQVNGVEDMLYMSGTCTSNGEYRLTVTFKVGIDLDMASVRVQNRVAMALPTLPEEVQRQGVTTKKESTNMVLVISMTSTEGRYDDLFMSNYATLRIKDELSRLEGVGNVTVYGADEYSMRIWLDLEKLRTRALTTTDVINAVREQNVQVAAGQIGQPPAPRGQKFQYILNVRGRLVEQAEFENIVLKTDPEGRLTRVRDVARVELGSKSYDISGNQDGKPSINIAISQLPGANALQLTENVKAKMKELSANFPDGLTYAIPFDTTDFIDASIREVMKTLWIAAILVFVVILVFLQDWRATLIPAVTIPVSLIGTFAVMGALGFGINTLTLFGLVLAIGIVVDDAIVVVENTTRNIKEHKLAPREATIRAMGEVTSPIIAITLVLMAVFIPVAFVGGITGVFYRQFALTIAASSAISGLNALTLSPALCAIFLRKPSERSNRFTRAFNLFFAKTSGLYRNTTVSIIRRGVLMLLLYAVLGAGSYWGFVSLPTGFIPTEDQGLVFLNVQLPDAASKERTDNVVDVIGQRLGDIEGIESYITVSGFSFVDSAAAPNTASVFITLDPWEERTAPPLNIDAILGRLRREFDDIQDADIMPYIPPDIQGLGRSGGFEMQLQDRSGVNLAALQQLAQEMAADANAQAELTGVYSTFRANVPQRFVDIDRTKIKTLDVSMSSVFDTLQAGMGTFYVNDFNKFGRTYQVRLQGAPAFRNRSRDIKRLEVRSNRGKMIPLGTLVAVKKMVAPQTVQRHNMYPAAAIRGTAAAGYSSGEALELMESMAKAKLPNTMGFEWTGMSFQEKATGGKAGMILALAVVFVYLVLCALYESWSLPLAVILVVPLALLGTVIGVAIRGFDVNVYTQIGLVVLIALASKNAILIVEFARDLRAQGKGILEAAVEAAKIRFRPVLMTSIAFIAGVFPLAVATGAGAASRQALGTAVCFGMIAGTVLALIFVPVFYVVIQRLNEWIRFGKTKCGKIALAEKSLRGK